MPLDPPQVAIVKPQEGSTVSGIIEIECHYSSSRPISSVQLWIDGQPTGISSSSEPFTLLWNTSDHSNGNYQIKLVAFDALYNSAESISISVFVKNPQKIPQITSINYIGNGFEIKWEQASSVDFNYYQLYEAHATDRTDSTLLYTTYDQNDNTFFVGYVGEDVIRYYWLITAYSNSQKISSRVKTGCSFPKIVFRSDRDGNSEIYIMNFDGGFPQNLTQSSEPEDQPQFSPDGSKIVFEKITDDNRDIWIMNSNGSQKTNLTPNTVNDVSFSLSPLGDKIVYVSYPQNNSEIVVMDIDGGNKVFLTNNQESDFNPRFSYDGSKIVFESTRSGSRQICIMSSDGSDQVVLTSSEKQKHNPQFSPHEAKILYEIENVSLHNIAIISVAGTAFTNVTDNHRDNKNACFFPDRNAIIYQSDRSGQTHLYYQYLDLESRPVQQITVNSSGNRNPRVSSDGRFVVFQSYRNGYSEIFILNLENLQETQLTANPGYDGLPVFEPR
jgi:Tol biopolymer transport system component